MKNFKEFDFVLNDNQLPLNSINIGCAAANSIVGLKRRDEIANKDIYKFCKKCGKMLIDLIEKLLEGMAVILAFVRSLQCVILYPVHRIKKRKVYKAVPMSCSLFVW